MTDNINPAHYRQGDVECIDAIKAQLTSEEYRGYLKGNAAKYVWRERHKGGTESIQKARWYLDRLIAEQTQPQPAKPARAEELQADDQGPSCSCPSVAYRFVKDEVARHICAEKPVDDGWIEWGGGGCPVDVGARLDIRLKDGDEYRGIAARDVIWTHACGPANVAAYRIAKEQA